MDSRISVEDLICPICSSVFDEPKLLPCAHRFCRKCLLDYVGSRSSNHCPCPLCKASFRGDRSYPTDSILQNLIQDRKDECRVHGLRRTRYCISCCLLACAECVMVKHKTCKSVVSVARAGNAMRQQLFKTREDIDDLLSGLESAEENADLKRKQTVNAYCDMSHQLDQMQEALMSPISDMHNALNEDLKSNVAMLKTYTEENARMTSRLREVFTSLEDYADIDSLDDESLFQATSDLEKKRGLLRGTRDHLKQSLDIKVPSLKLAYKVPTANLVVKIEKFSILTPECVPQGAFQNSVVRRLKNFLTCALDTFFFTVCFFGLLTALMQALFAVIFLEK
ncbi:tripartite motif-containing 13-like isoform X2 [Haliotis rubra]|uniref:tripartite motif-containing 13-like isoform X2 n=1 Tax=Haliotis rubra TaxID=36100 RepID=UPI001EE503EC|nr:tripartite motif-containing 13-like isoform X2 [Haliotis rubra]XP_046548316.1 tripartite motif-containing 13-like isoform X2 [Haliotis rubra]